MSFKYSANLPGIPKEVAFNAFADINFRKTWDDLLAKTNFIEEDK